MREIEATAFLATELSERPVHRTGERRFAMGKGLIYTALTIAIVGAVNWGLIGLFRFDLVAFLFGSMTVFSRLIYGLVGICGLYLLTLYGRVGRTTASES